MHNCYDSIGGVTYRSGRQGSGWKWGKICDFIFMLLFWISHSYIHCLHSWTDAKLMHIELIFHKKNHSHGRFLHQPITCGLTCLRYTYGALNKPQWQQEPAVLKCPWATRWNLDQPQGRCSASDPVIWPPRLRGEARRKNKHSSFRDQ